MGRTKERRGVYFGDREWREETGFTWFPETPFESNKWKSIDSDGTSFKLIRQLSERVTMPPDEWHILGSASAVYIADQYTGIASRPSRTQVIVKIHIRIPNISVRKGNEYVSTKDLHSHHLPLAEQFPSESISNFDDEAKTLRHLTDHKCPHTPSLITSFQLYQDNPWVKDGFMGFIVMEKLPAVCIADIWKYEPSSEAQRQEQLRMHEAFKVALLSVLNMGVGPLDANIRHLMWDVKARKCYLIDFEITAVEIRAMCNRTWEEYERHAKGPFLTFAKWDIIMQDQATARHKVLYPNSA